MAHCIVTLTLPVCDTYVLSITGQLSASDEEPALKKPKQSSTKKPETKPETKSKPESPTSTDDVETTKEELKNSPEPTVGIAAESVPQLSLERPYVPLTQGQTIPEASQSNEILHFPASYAGGIITTVTVSGKDPRTAMSSSSTSAVSSSMHPITTTDKVSVGESKSELSRSVLPAPKSILTKPSSSSDSRYLAVPPSLNVRYVCVRRKCHQPNSILYLKL